MRRAWLHSTSSKSASRSWLARAPDSAETPGMEGDEDLLTHLRAAFSGPRPAQFTNAGHCCECAEHDAVLQERDIATLTFDDMGNGAWDPITMAQPPAFAYFLPALARIALDEPHEEWGWFGPQLFQ